MRLEINFFYGGGLGVGWDLVNGLVLLISIKLVVEVGYWVVRYNFI